MKFRCIEFSWRAAFIGFYMTPERDKVWITIVPFFFRSILKKLESNRDDANSVLFVLSFLGRHQAHSGVFKYIIYMER